MSIETSASPELPTDAEYLALAYYQGHNVIRASERSVISCCSKCWLRGSLAGPHGYALTRKGQRAYEAYEKANPDKKIFTPMPSASRRIEIGAPEPTVVPPAISADLHDICRKIITLSYMEMKQFGEAIAKAIDPTATGIVQRDLQVQTIDALISVAKELSAGKKPTVMR